MGPSSSTAASLPFPSLTSDTLSSSSACTANFSTLEPAVDDEDVPGRLLRPLFIARGNLLEKVGTAIGPTGRHTGRCAFFMAFSTREYEIIQPSEGILNRQLSRVFHELQYKRCLRLSLYPMSQYSFLIEALMSPEMDQIC